MFLKTGKKREEKRRRKKIEFHFLNPFGSLKVIAKSMWRVWILMRCKSYKGFPCTSFCFLREFKISRHPHSFAFSTFWHLIPSREHQRFFFIVEMWHFSGEDSSIQNEMIDENEFEKKKCVEKLWCWKESVRFIIFNLSHIFLH